MAENKFDTTVEALFKGMDGFLTTKTVVGDAVRFEDGTIILPLVDVSFGVAAGAWSKESAKSGTSGGGMGGKITPSAVVVMKDGHAKLVNVKNQDTVTKVLDLIPDVIDKVKDFKSGDKKSRDAEREKVDSVVVESMND